MKTRSIIFVTALVLISFSSCSKIQDSLTVKVPVEFKNDLQVKSTTPGLKSGPYSFSSDAEFNPSTDPTVVQYKAKIKNIEASGIAYTPSGLSEDVLIIEATLIISDGLYDDTYSNRILWKFGDLKLENGVKVDLSTPDHGTLADLSTLLNGNQTIYVYWSGTQDTPVDPYTFSTTLKAEVTAYLLKK